MKITAVIMAGGKGERFWPKSRESHPKQFLSLTDDGETMIQKTVNRISPLVQSEDIFIVTNACYKPLVKKQLPDIPEENILAEPCGRNTAPCIAFASAVIKKKYGNAVMLVLPSDHLIKYENIYTRTLCNAIVTATEGNNLVTIGITPTYPETGYGYINFSEESGNAYKVERFVEKPDLRTAKKYLSSGKYLWNSGMFVWQVSAIEERFRNFMPEVFSGAEKIVSLLVLKTLRKSSKKSIINFRLNPLISALWKNQTTYIPFRQVSGGTTWQLVSSRKINDTDDNQN